MLNSHIIPDRTKAKLNKLIASSDEEITTQVSTMIKKHIKSLLRYSVTFGIDPLRTFRSFRGVPDFLVDYFELKKQRPKDNTHFDFGRFYPCLDDRFGPRGHDKGHYFHQDLLVASRIFVNQPERHIDVGSRIDGFVAHVASFRKIIVVDIRPLKTHIHNVESFQADLMKEVPAELVESCDSLSCLHVLEHFGLGRYGDPICWDGYRIGFYNLLTMLKPGGKFYFSVPVGEQRIEFNAHRVFSIAYLLEIFSGRLRIDDYSYVDDQGDLHESVILDESNISSNCGCFYGCGIFELTKLDIFNDQARNSRK